MLYDISGCNESISFDFYSTHRHGCTVMISKVKRQALCKIDRENGRVLSLVVDVNVRLAGVTGVSTLADHLSFLDHFSWFHAHAPLFQMCNDQIGASLHLEEDMVPGWGYQIV